jgi:hypothetical protein
MHCMHGKALLAYSGPLAIIYLALHHVCILTVCLQFLLLGEGEISKEKILKLYASNMSNINLISVNYM